MYVIDYAVDVANDLASLRAYDRKRILDEIEKQLSHEPARQTGKRKILFGLIPPWEQVEPV